MTSLSSMRYIIFSLISFHLSPNLKATRVNIKLINANDFATNWARFQDITYGAILNLPFGLHDFVMQNLKLT